LLTILLGACTPAEKDNKLAHTEDDSLKSDQPFLVVLGNIQDAGSPHIGCTKECCKKLLTQPDATRIVVALGLVDPKQSKKFLVEATPDISAQLKVLQSYLPANSSEVPDGIFLTHAHIGHYTGLMFLGKEAWNAKEVPVYAMPVMHSFLSTNGPWSQLVNNKNIVLQKIEDQQSISITPALSIIPFTVPHRDEYSETVGYKIIGPTKSALFIPDIDKWSKWKLNIVEELKKVDYAFVDATFFDAAEINHRDIAEIPHPFVIESMELFASLNASEKQKVWFIHMNHTNPLLNPDSDQSKQVEANGFNVARFKSHFAL
jgi:pyrroloquinoline quinone biosynthesis protein B